MKNNHSIIISSFLFVCLFSQAYGRLVFLEGEALPFAKTQISYSLLQGGLQQETDYLDIQTSCKNVQIKEYEGQIMSGYLNVGIHNSKSALGFIFYGAKGVSLEDMWTVPTVFWLNGGPGCSSQFGNFIEIGPLKIKIQDMQNQNNFRGTHEQKQFSFDQNEHSWSEHYNLVFVDQPVGTGISYAETTRDIPKNQTTIANHFYHALQELYYSKNGCFYNLNMDKSPMFMFGESYAGKYIPSIASFIIEQGNKFNLKGIGLGDAFTSPYDTIESINEFALESGMIDNKKFDQNKKIITKGQNAMNQSRWTEAGSYFNELIAQSNPMGVDVYNIKRSFLPSTQELDDFFNSQYGQQLFGVKLSKHFSQCDSSIYSELQNDIMKQYAVEQVEYILNSGIVVTIFNGDLDLIVPYQAPLKWMQKLNWKHSKEFNSQQFVSWGDKSKVFGEQKSFAQLLFFKVFQSGHMVPSDQPEAAMDLIKRVIDHALEKEHRSE